GVAVALRIGVVGRGVGVPAQCDDLRRQPRVRRIAVLPLGDRVSGGSEGDPLSRRQLGVRDCVIGVGGYEATGVGDLDEVVLCVVLVLREVLRRLRVDLRIGFREHVASGVVGIVSAVGIAVHCRGGVGYLVSVL